jgi:hypothetical protein
LRRRVVDHGTLVPLGSGTDPGFDGVHRWVARGKRLFHRFVKLVLPISERQLSKVDNGGLFY